MSKINITYRCTGPDGQSASVTSGRAARALAREWLGVARVTETPTEHGWQLWPVSAAEDTDRVVGVVVVRP